MDVNEMLAQLREELRDTTAGNQKWLDSRLIQDLNDGQVHVGLMIGGIEETTTLSITANQYYISLPGDYLMVPIDRLTVRYLVSTNVYRTLKPRSFSWMKRKTRSLRTGNPTYFSVWNGYLWLDTQKTSAESDAIDFSYYKKGATLAADGECDFDEIYHQLIVLYAAKTRARREREYELAGDLEDLLRAELEVIEQATGPLGGTQSTGEFSDEGDPYDFEYE